LGIYQSILFITDHFRVASLAALDHVIR
jgi:hypothetical protein